MVVVMVVMVVAAAAVAHVPQFLKGHTFKLNPYTPKTWTFYFEVQSVNTHQTVNAGIMGNLMRKQLSKLLFDP